MSSYNATPDTPSKARAIAGVIAVHVALGAAILTGLNVETVRKAVDQMRTIAVFEPEPPPPPPPPDIRPETARKDPGAPARKAEPTPVVAPKPRIPAPSPIPAAKVAGQGSSAISGAESAGSGTGAGGTGAGTGGGGAGFTPARRIAKIPDREYRRLAGTGIASGSVGVTIKVNLDGSVSNCRVARSSGDRAVDRMMCDMTLRHVRFEPARDPSGRAVAQDVTFYPNWWKP
jgi:protein TonB